MPVIKKGRNGFAPRSSVALCIPAQGTGIKFHVSIEKLL
jgi:hypothetical protein